MRCLIPAQEMWPGGRLPADRLRRKENRDDRKQEAWTSEAMGAGGPGRLPGVQPAGKPAGKPAPCTDYGQSAIDLAAPGGFSPYPHPVNAFWPLDGKLEKVPSWAFDEGLTTDHDGGWMWAAGRSEPKVPQAPLAVNHVRESHQVIPFRGRFREGPYSGARSQRPAPPLLTAIVPELAGRRARGLMWPSTDWRLPH